ncbi:MAG: hydroxymethylbilane synthase [Armatimonadia bacterium]|nr:hydroxymethylbilane synthase [Armatimonadia bacterium]
MARVLTLATRGSKLALAQSEWVGREIERHHPDTRVELVTIRTQGDKVQDVALSKVGGKGLFVKEIEEALLDGSADLAVHSLKDLPTAMPDGLCIGAVGGAVDPRDVLISRDGRGLNDLPEGAVIGTSSLRRQAQLAHTRPDLTFEPIRGNVDTRLRKLDEGQADAIILAGAGLMRLGLTGRITEWLPIEACVPAVGQGLLAIEIRQGDDETESLLRFLGDETAAHRALAERAALACLEGGCQTPIGIHATPARYTIAVEGVVAGPSGQPYYRARETSPASDPTEAGRRLADRLRAMGAGELVG